MRPNNSIRALVIEDVEDDAMLLVQALQRNGIDVCYECVETIQELKSALEKEWDIVYSDYTLPGFNGLDALDVLPAGPAADALRTLCRSLAGRTH